MKPITRQQFAIQHKENDFNTMLFELHNQRISAEEFEEWGLSEDSQRRVFFKQDLFRFVHSLRLQILDSTSFTSKIFRVTITDHDFAPYLERWPYSLVDFISAFVSNELTFEIENITYNSPKNSRKAETYFDIKVSFD